MKPVLFSAAFVLSFFISANAQTDAAKKITTSAVLPGTPEKLILEKLNASTEVKNQGQTGTCWCFSGTSLLESQFLKANNAPIDISEMYTVRNIYMEKAKNYFMRQGHAQFGEGGLGHDVIRSIENYGAMPESAFSGLKPGATSFDHGELVSKLKAYLDSQLILAGRGDRNGNWRKGVNDLLKEYIGEAPAEFSYAGKNYTARSFAKDYLHFKASDYVNLTSFTDHPYYSSYVLNIPDNFSNESFYNVPLDELSGITKNAVRTGYTVLWDADVSNNGFSQQTGVALNVPKGTVIKGADAINTKEDPYSVEKRQELFENLTTQDDHLMHIIGLEKNNAGHYYFIVKNSWGPVGPYKGYINVSEPYFAMNTISLVVPKAALTKAQKEKMHLQ